MERISDSHADYDENRMYSQHFAALMILQSKLDNPKIGYCNWLDLGCGKGQIVSQLEENLSAESRRKLSYYGYDIDVSNTTEVNKLLMHCGLKGKDFEVGDISKFSTHYQNTEFDFITVTNCFHEFPALMFGKIIWDILLKLKPDGNLFLFDMEKLPKRELGAITWSKQEVSEIVKEILHIIGISDYSPKAGQWKHKNISSWNIHIQRQYFEVELDSLFEKKDEIITKINAVVEKILKRKYLDAKNALESLTTAGIQNQEEDNVKIDSLYDFWALSRIMEEEK